MCVVFSGRRLAEVGENVTEPREHFEAELRAPGASVGRLNDSHTEEWAPQPQVDANASVAHMDSMRASADRRLAAHHCNNLVNEGMNVLRNHMNADEVFQFFNPTGFSATMRASGSATARHPAA